MLFIQILPTLNSWRSKISVIGSGVETSTPKKMPGSVPAPPSNEIEPEEVDTSLLFWNVNIPQKRWTREHPPYLANLSDKDKGILSLRDCDFKYHDWNAARDIIRKTLFADAHHWRWWQRTASCEVFGNLTRAQQGRINSNGFSVYQVTFVATWNIYMIWGSSTALSLALYSMHDYTGMILLLPENRLLPTPAITKSCAMTSRMLWSRASSTSWCG